MNARLLLAAAALLGGALLGTALLTDAMTSEAGELVVPAVDAAAPVVALDTSSPEFGGLEGMVPIEFESPAAGAVLVPVESPAPAASGDDSDPESDAGYPWIIERRELAPSAPGLPAGPDPWIRFLDLCAEAPSLPACPPGIGGTVFGHSDGHGGGGEFDVFVINSIPSEWWQCTPGSLGEFEVPVLVAATLPARMEIDYYPVGEPDAVRSVVVDLTDPEGEILREFIATGGVPSRDGVHHCFALEATTAEPGVVVGDAPTLVISRYAYQVDVQATSYTGETDTHSQVVDIPRDRPPVALYTASQYEIAVGVPLRSDPEMSSIVRVLYANEGLGCADVETAVLSGEHALVVAAPSRGGYEGRSTRTTAGFPVFDPTYDVWDEWTANLEEGTDYLLCVWWLRSPEASFDPLSLLVVERESRPFSTPDLLRTVISTTSMASNADDGPSILAESYRVFVPRECAVRSIDALLPPVGPGLGDIEPMTILGYPEILLCQYRGTEQPFYTTIGVEGPDGTTQEFLVPSFTTSIPSESHIFLDLSADAELAVRISHVDGASNGLVDWSIGSPGAFAGVDPPPTELSDWIEIDHLFSRVDTIDRQSIRVNALFDRPVTLVATLDAVVFGDEPCLDGGEAVKTLTEFAAEHVFVFDGLCADTQYKVSLAPTDADGNSMFAGEWFGYGITDGYHVTFAVAIGDRLPVTSTERLRAGWNVWVDEEYVAIGHPSRCLIEVATEPQTAVWGETVTLEIEVALYSARLGSRGHCLRIYESGYFEENASVTTTFSVEAFRSGPIVVRIPIGSSGSLTVDVVVTGSIED